MTGKKIGYWTVIRVSDRKGKSLFWECECICGKIGIVEGCRLRRGASKSCRCRQQEFRLEKRVTHGDTRGRVSTKEFKAWMSMIGRCTKPNHQSYPNYGGRGIGICKRWLSFYENFLEDMGRAPTSEHSLDRINNDKGYYKKNCRWATKKEQALNKRSNRYITYKGVKKLIADWAKELKVWRESINHRLKQGKSFHWIYIHFKNRK